MPERDYPVGHPAASDYKGEPYKAPHNAMAEDFPEGHKARGGGNVAVLDNPDGRNTDLLNHANDLQELAAVGSLPPLKDPDTGEALQLSPEQLAHVYRVRMGLRTEVAQQITDRYKLDPMPARKDEAAVPALTAEDQALGYIRSLGFTPERAKEILDKYGVPDVMKDREADSHR